MFPKIILSSFSLFFISLFLNSPILAQVVINEIYPNPQGEEGGAEWVELYNSSSTPISLSGCTLYLNNTDIYQNVVFDSEDFIDKFKVISWDDSWLNNTGDTVRLVCPLMNDSFPYGEAEGKLVNAPPEAMSIGRSPDGSSSFYELISVTQGTANPPPPSATPVPTATPNPTNTNTPTPMNSPTNKPTSTPTAIKTPTKKPTEVPSEELNNEQVESGEVLSLASNGNFLKVTPVNGNGNESEIGNEIENEDIGSFLLPLLFIIVGVVFIGAAVYLFVKSKKGEKATAENEEDSHSEPISN